MTWMSVRITEIASFLSKLTIGNLLEVIKYKITGLKRSQLTKNNFNILTEKPENLPTG